MPSHAYENSMDIILILTSLVASMGFVWLALLILRMV
jgi:hypothetical protein